MNKIQRHVYDFELMEQMNTILVVSLVLTGLPSRTASSGKVFSFLDVLPVTEREGQDVNNDVVESGVTEPTEPKQEAGKC